MDLGNKQIHLILKENKLPNYLLYDFLTNLLITFRHYYIMQKKLLFTLKEMITFFRDCTVSRITKIPIRHADTQTSQFIFY